MVIHMNMTDNCCYLLRQMSTPVSKQNLIIYLQHQNSQMNNAIKINGNFNQSTKTSLILNKNVANANFSPNFRTLKRNTTWIP